MAKRFITELNCSNTDDVGQHRAKIYYSSEYEEYQVIYYRHAARLVGADYFTPCKDDAKLIAKAVIQSAERALCNATN